MDTNLTNQTNKQTSLISSRTYKSSKQTKLSTNLTQYELLI